MKQIFIIETKEKITNLELLGCLEDTLGNNKIISVEEITPVYVHEHLKDEVFIEIEYKEKRFSGCLNEVQE